MARSKVELWGELTDRPELRITPGGQPVLRLKVDCGRPGDGLRLDVVMTGETGRDLARTLRPGHQVYVLGELRAAVRRSRAGLREPLLEVVAREITPAEETPEGNPREAKRRAGGHVGNVDARLKVEHGG